MKKSILIVAAHPDDEVLGCGGTIAKHVQNGDVVNVVILAQGVASRYSGNVEKKRYQKEISKLKDSAHEANEILGVNLLILYDLPDNRMDILNRLEVVKMVESFVSRFNPEIIYTHHISDINIDHSIVNQSVLTACRPYPDQIVKKILFFEIPSSTEWQSAACGFCFSPNWFVDITETLGLKIAALNAYESEIRRFPHARSVEALQSLARWRGASIGVPAAEAFVLGRSLE